MYDSFLHVIQTHVTKNKNYITEKARRVSPPLLPNNH